MSTRNWKAKAQDQSDGTVHDVNGTVGNFGNKGMQEAAIDLHVRGQAQANGRRVTTYDIQVDD